MNRLVLQVVLFQVLFLLFVAADDFSGERDVTFILRKRGWPGKPEETFRFGTKKDIVQSSFDPSKPTIFLIHGFLENRKITHHTTLSKIILQLEDQNLFFVDWGSDKPTFLYPIARMRVEKVAQGVASFINLLHERASLNFTNVTLIGFSLGAHIAGLAGKKFINDKIGKVIGLDPAGPKFDVKDPENRLSPESATYTECIHTGFYLGIREPICHADFYVNSGARQPGCDVLFGSDFAPCSHMRVMEIFMEGFVNPKAFYGRRCQSLDDALHMTCRDEPGAFINDENNASNNLTGIFHVSTNRVTPFGKGQPTL